MALPLVVEHLSKTYERPHREPVRAVRDVSFTIERGECFGLLGPNGAGKSTTMNCIVGFYLPTAGRIWIEGIDVHLQPKQARRYLGVCAQEENLDTDFTVLNQMVRHGTYFGIPLPECRHRATQLLERFGLYDRRDEMVESLSGGMRRRLQVARAWISHPPLLILDEPTTGLDPEARRELWEIILEFRNQGGAVLLSTHYMDEAERLCDQVAIIHQGSILDCDCPQRLIERHIGTGLIEEEVRPQVIWRRPPNLEDVYLKLTGSRLGVVPR